MRRLIILPLLAVLALSACGTEDIPGRDRVPTIERKAVEREVAKQARKQTKRAVRSVSCPLRPRFSGISATVNCRVSLAGGKRATVPVRLTPLGFSVDTQRIRVR